MINRGWIVTNENIGFAHYFDGRRHALSIGSRCGEWFDSRRERRPAAFTDDKAREPSKLCSRCLRSILALLPEPMRAAVEAQESNFAGEMAQRYLLAPDEETRADILAFFESDGPRKVHESKLKHNDGIPTSADLEAQFGEGAP